MAVIQPDSIIKRSFKGIARDATESPAAVLLAAFTSAVQKQTGRKMIWAPVFLLAGIWTYFYLHQEPSWFEIILLAVIAASLGWASRFWPALIIVALVLTGFVLAKTRQEFVATSVLRAVVAESDISGYIADADNKGDKRRVLAIELDSSTNIPSDEIPKRVRISTFNAPNALIGDYIKFKARLTPLPMPVMPGGFDYGRDLYFQSIGAIGRNITPPIFEDRAVPWKFVVRRFFHRLRSTMGARITAAIPGPIGAFANSIVTGERSAIPKDMTNSLQISGLAHIISISGLHMSLVAGGIFWVTRAFLALFPFLALNFPIKKWSAVAALIVGFIYMLLADSGSATERSYIMIAVMFFAILVDRPAISMRNLAIAAIIVLVVSPEEAVGASFQMSFLAVMGLAAFFEWWNQRQIDVKHIQQSLVTRSTFAFFKFIGGAVLTTVVAGGLSSIAAAYHFGRVSPYGTVANALALPISDFIVMPAAMLAVLLMPFGMEGWPLYIVEQGLRATMWISDTIVAWPGANAMMPHPSLFGVSVMVFGALFICLISGKLRFFGLAFLLGGFLFGETVTRPQILVEERASNIAVRNNEGRLVLVDPTKGKFAAEKWLQANGEVTTMAEASARVGWTCMENMCFSDVSPLSISYIHEPTDTNWECPPTEIIIADFPLRDHCKEAKIKIDRFDVWKYGAYAIYIDGPKWSLETVKGTQGNRPWVYESRSRTKFGSNTNYLANEAGSSVSDLP